MKRDLNFMLELLRFIEAGDYISTPVDGKDGLLGKSCSSSKLTAYLILAMAAGYIKTNYVAPVTTAILTWKGHEYLHSIAQSESELPGCSLDSYHAFARNAGLA